MVCPFGDNCYDTDEIMETASLAAKEGSIVVAGDIIVITAGVPMDIRAHFQGFLRRHNNPF